VREGLVPRWRRAQVGMQPLHVAPECGEFSSQGQEEENHEHRQERGMRKARLT